MSDRRVSIACGIVAMAVSSIAVVAVLSGQSGGISALVRTASDDPIAALTRSIDPDFRFVEPGGHYDGSFFYAVAIDPLARGDAHDKIDRAPYRYAHPGYGWAAWIVSVGHPTLVPAALFLIGLLGMGVAAFSASSIATHFGWSPWWGGLVVAFNPGLIFSVTADTSEPIGLALMGLLLLAWINKRWGWVAVLSVAICLTKEPLIVVPVGLVFWELLKGRRGHPSPDARARIVALAAGPVAFGLWNVYLRSRFGVWPTSDASDLLTLPPFAGWVDTFSRAADVARRGNDPMQVATFAISVLPAIGGVLLIGFFKAFRLRTWLDGMFICFALIVFSLNWLQLLNPKDLAREVAIAFVLLPAMLVRPRSSPDSEELAQPG